MLIVDQIIYASDSISRGGVLFAVRGWGYLTGKGHGALGLSNEQATAIQKANAEFVTNARTDIPLLISEIKRLRAHVDWLIKDSAKDIDFLGRQNIKLEEMVERLARDLSNYRLCPLDGRFRCDRDVDDQTMDDCIACWRTAAEKTVEEVGDD